MQKTHLTLKETIYSMLTEGTGKALCDSGGESGRHWQKNQGKSMRDFENEPDVSVDDYGYTLSVFQVMYTDLTLDETCQEFNRINENVKDWDSDLAYGLSSEGEAYLESIGAEVKRTWNSYNWNASFSQTLQGANILINDEEYVLIQIHQGADVRGGYTNARLFRADVDYPLSEQVYGHVMRGDEEFQISNMYNGETLTLEDSNEDYEYIEGDQVELTRIES